MEDWLHPLFRMKRGGSLLVPYASITKIQQEQIKDVDQWPEFTPQEAEPLDNEVSEWAFRYLSHMRMMHDKGECDTDAHMPYELVRGTISKVNTAVVSSASEEDEDPLSDNQFSDEDGNDYVADYDDVEDD